MDGWVGIVQHFSSHWQILSKKFFITFFCDLYPLSGQYCSAVSLPCSPGECKNISKTHVGSAVVILVDRILVMAYVYFNTSWVEMCGMHNIIYMSRVIHFNCYLQCVTYFFMAGHNYAPGSFYVIFSSCPSFLLLQRGGKLPSRCPLFHRSTGQLYKITYRLVIK